MSRPDLIVPIKERRKHKRIVTVRNLRKASIVTILVAGTLNLESALRHVPRDDFGGLMNRQLARPAVKLSRNAPRIDVRAIADETTGSADAPDLLQARAAHEEYLQPSDGSDPILVGFGTEPGVGRWESQQAYEERQRQHPAAPAQTIAKVVEKVVTAAEPEHVIATAAKVARAAEPEHVVATAVKVARAAQPERLVATAAKIARAVEPERVAAAAEKVVTTATAATQAASELVTEPAQPAPAGARTKIQIVGDTGGVTVVRTVATPRRILSGGIFRQQ